ncbi:MAG: hypothetical protein ABJN78_09710, partial [Hyphomicrobiales bacterium]
LVDTPDLGSCGASRAGSRPSARTSSPGYVVITISESYTTGRHHVDFLKVRFRHSLNYDG